MDHSELPGLLPIQAGPRGWQNLNPSQTTTGGSNYKTEDYSKDICSAEK